ncbi:hypothetical protein MLD38_037820 [Melastoma candidum]|uniref:Uncharacterized protein n=1 Tax=Melastoma candidum TaxID=119954 RepID=A0ACB9LPS5_9MYRT|nr:hypothetical protein MLD38_037820 [Melastoma candidum]
MVTRGLIPMSIIVAIAFTCVVSNVQCQKPLAPALYVFGASTVDAGNNKILRNEEKDTSFPYGVDLQDPSLLARASNGLTYADFIAEHLGLPLPPPVLSFKDAETRSKVLTGMNYASSASGVLNQTGLITGKCLSFSKQIDLFETTVKEDLPKQIPTDLKLHLEESIILISFAENDYVLGYFLNGTISPQLDLDSYTRLLIQSFSASIERMVDLGAKRFVVSGMPPIGCSSFFLEQNQGKCNETMNKIGVSYNSQLTAVLDQLKTNRAIYYTLINPEKLDIRIVAAEMGMKHVFEQCCETDRFGNCIKGLKPCDNRDEYLLFDKHHITQIYLKYIADGCFKGSGMCLPCNIVELCRK